LDALLLVVLFIRLGYFVITGVHSAVAAYVQSQAHAIPRFGFVTTVSDAMSSGIPALLGEASDDGHALPPSAVGCSVAVGAAWWPLSLGL